MNNNMAKFFKKLVRQNVHKNKLVKLPNGMVVNQGWKKMYKMYKKLYKEGKL